LNICLNARDALESCGKKNPSIRIQLDTVSGESSRDPREWVRVRITDNGGGMPDEVRARVFEPFFTTKEVGRGTGLGLATAYAIVADHGGRLFCESTVGAGTTFTVLLPVTARSMRPSLVPKRKQPGGTETVLVIDDERLVRNAVRGVLEPAGYRVLEAPDGESGLTLFQRERDRVDVVLLDLTIPGSAGESLFQSLRSDVPSAKVVLLAPYRTLSVPEGAAGVLQKPFELDELLRIVREVCDASPAAMRIGSR
jgi:CheY-like chemotaxis protein